MPKFSMQETIGTNVEEAFTARLGAGTGSANWLSDADVGKAVKQVTGGSTANSGSRYDLCVAGDPIEGFIIAVESATADNYTIGSVVAEGRKRVVCDGSQAAGTGSLVIGDYVVAGTITAKATAFVASGTATEFQKVRKATWQPGVTETTAVGDVNEQLKPVLWAWRVIELFGDGSVGTQALIERVNC